MIERMQELRRQMQHVMQPVAQRCRRAEGHLQIFRIGYLKQTEKGLEKSANRMTLGSF